MISRASLPVLVGSLSLLLASTALAEERHRRSEPRPGATRAVGDSAVRSETGGKEDRAGAVARSPEGDRGVRDGDGRRGCRRGARPVAGAPCDYYYDDDDDDGSDYEPSAGEARQRPARAPADSAATPSVAPGAAAAKMAPNAEKFEAVESFTPHTSATLRDELIAARRNWMAKQSRFEAISKKLADAEYQAYKTGSSVDPALAASRKQAEAEVAAARAAMSPLVERARKAGIAPGVIKLYEESAESD